MAAATTTRRSTSRTAKAEQARARLAAAPKPSETPKAAAKPAAKSQPKPKPQPLGPTGYRLKFGLADGDMLKAIREYAGSHDDLKAVTKWDDAKVLAAIGWATSLAGALAKLRKAAA